MGDRWDKFRVGLREALGPKPIPTRMTEAQAIEAARPTIDERGGVGPEQEVWASAVADGGSILWSVKVMQRGAVRGGHLHVQIDDATGKVVKIFDVPH